MNFEVDVLELATADLRKPSAQLQAFLLQMRSFLSFISANFRTVEGYPIVHTFLRSGPKTVWESAKGQELSLFNEIVNAQEDGAVWMDQDQPGNWTVMRICTDTREVPGASAFVTLRANDFANGRAENVFKNVIGAAARSAATVPTVGSKLQQALWLLK